MAKITKKRKSVLAWLESSKTYPANEACDLLKKAASANFVESFEVAVNLGVDPRKSDQLVRGSTSLPHGTGKTVKVAVFAQGTQADKALAAGADRVGFDDLAEDMKNGDINYDVVIATPDSMALVGRLGPLLGPKGLMPNPKVGTVTTNVDDAVTSFKAGQIRYRVDKGGTIHSAIGKVDFQTPAIIDNLSALVSDLKKQKPASAKGVYLKKITLSTTMGPSVQVDLASIER